MKSHDALVQIEQMLRGIAAACNRADRPDAGLAAQQALVAVDGLHAQLSAEELDQLEFEPVASESDGEADEMPSGMVRQ